MWKNTVQPGRLQTSVWRMATTCCISEATNPHSEYVILIAFPLQHWLHERASILLDTHIGCLFEIVSCSVILLDVKGYLRLFAWHRVSSKLREGLVTRHDVTYILRRLAVVFPSGLQQPGRGRSGNEIPAPLQPRRQPQGKWRRAGRAGLRGRRQHGECSTESKILRPQPETEF